MADQNPEFRVDFGDVRGRIRPMHSANNGPLCLGGLMDLSDGFRELGHPMLRLHDCQWPADLMVDIHAVFPDPDADPDDPTSYDFAITDDYLKAIVDLGMGIEYRLGCRIEHTARRRNAHPPKDFDRWARVCIGIIRHVNEGWASGHQWGIRHWEIWNEPDIPPGCWSGDWASYYDLYVTAARAIKAACPDVLVGGPAYAYANDDHAFVEGLLSACKERGAPLDFFSWHTYAGRDLTVWERHARTMRDLLDAHGFAGTPTHLNEWNCCPDGDWQDWPTFARGLNGPRGASGVATSLALFQDLPIDEAFLYTADTLVYGLYTREGERQKNWHAVSAFSRLLETPLRAATVGSDAAAGLGLLAGLSDDGRSAQIMASRYVAEGPTPAGLSVTGLPWTGQTRVTLHQLDADHDLAPIRDTIVPAGDLRLNDPLPPATVRLYRLTPA